MKLQIKKCKTCGALGVGPNRIKLWPFENRLYCAEHYKEALQWHEQRDHVTGGVERMREFHVSMFTKKRGAVLKGTWQDWTPYIYDLCGMAEFALLHDDKRTFVYYFSRALYAWTLKEMAR